MAGSLCPLKTLLISCITSGDNGRSVVKKAPMSSSSCSIEVAPMIELVTNGRSRANPSASWTVADQRVGIVDWNVLQRHCGSWSTSNRWTYPWLLAFEDRIGVKSRGSIVAVALHYCITAPDWIWEPDRVSHFSGSSEKHEEVGTVTKLHAMNRTQVIFLPVWLNELLKLLRSFQSTND